MNIAMVFASICFGMCLISIGTYIFFPEHYRKVSHPALVVAIIMYLAMIASFFVGLGTAPGV